MRALASVQQASEVRPQPSCGRQKLARALRARSCRSMVIIAGDRPASAPVAHPMTAVALRDRHARRGRRATPASQGAPGIWLSGTIVARSACASGWAATCARAVAMRLVHSCLARASCSGVVAAILPESPRRPRRLRRRLSRHLPARVRALATCLGADAAVVHVGRVLLALFCARVAGGSARSAELGGEWAAA